MTKAELQELEDLYFEVGTSKWICGDDGEPTYATAQEPGGGYMPWWAKDVPRDDSEGNPYRPYTMDFAAMSLVARLHNAFPKMLAMLRGIS